MKMGGLNIVPTESLGYSLLPLIIFGVVIVSIICLIIIGILIGRRVTINMKTGGAAALTFASIILLSGLWCMFLSPTTTYSKTEGDYYRPPVTIGGLSNWSYSVNVKEGDILTVSLNFILEIVDYNQAVDYNKTYDSRVNVKVYDPNNNVVWSEVNTTYTYFRMKTAKSGAYRIEVQNPNQQAITCYVQVTVSTEVTYRPLESLGSWLTLVSLPILGLGLWALRSSPTKERTKFCSNCGHEISLDAKFCPNCGKTIPSS